MPEESGIPEDVRAKLRKLIHVSDRIKQSQMRKILNLDEERFNQILLNLAEEFNFRIDGRYIVFHQAQDAIDAFINRIDSEITPAELDARHARLHQDDVEDPE